MITETPVEAPRKSLRALRIIAVLHTTCVLAQPALAGLYLSGVVDALFFHGRNGDTISVLGLAQLIAAIVFVWRGKGRKPALWTAIGIFLAEMVQMPLGIEGVVALHVPLGVSIVVGQILFTAWLFREGRS